MTFRHCLLVLALGLLPQLVWGAAPVPMPCGSAYAGVVSDAQLEQLGNKLREAAGTGALQPEVGRQFASREPYIDYLVEEGTFSARQMLGSDLLNVDWVEDRRLVFLLSRAVSVSDAVGRPIRVVEGYATAELGERVRSGKLPLDRWVAAFSALRKEPWTGKLEKRGDKTFIVFRRSN